MTETRHITVKQVLLVLFRILVTAFALYTVYFIFRNSLEAGAVSSLRSNEATGTINHMLTALGMKPLTTAVVRKLAHFGEFLVLGFWFTLCLRVYTRHYIRHISWPLLLGLLIADADELIQLYVAGRDSRVRDVWIDFGGVCTGVGCTLILLLLFGAIWYLLGFGRHKQMA